MEIGKDEGMKNIMAFSEKVCDTAEFKIKLEVQMQHANANVSLPFALCSKARVIYFWSNSDF